MILGREKLESGNGEFSIQFKVRDYECDMADGVNHAVYFNYLEHARNEMLKQHGVDFAEYTRKKISLVVVRIEIDFKRSLVSGDEFTVVTSSERLDQLRFQFNQKIFRFHGTDKKLIASAIVIGTVVNASGQAEIPEEIEMLFARSS